MARGSTGAPRNTPDPDVPAVGGDIRTAQTQDIQERGPRRRQARPGSPETSPDQGKPGKPRGVSRLIAFICGRRTKWAVVVFWLVVVAVLGSLAGKLQGAEKNDASSYLPASAESTQELNEQSIFQSKNYNPALVVYVRDSGITQADLAKADADARSFASLGVVDGRVAPPTVSSDHKAIETVIGSDLGYNSDLSGFITTVQNTATKNADGLSVYIGGPAASANDELKIFKGIDSTLLYAALGVVIVLLLLTYRSPVLWLLPIISAGVALTVSEAVIYLLVQHANLTVNGQSGGILVVLVIGASTDYALLLVARYREELRRHSDRHQAMAIALRRAGPAIIASGLTVVAGMLCLLAAQSNDISGLGPVAAIGVGVGLIAMITLLPALLVVFGRWIFWPVRPSYGSPEPTRRGVWARVGRAISGRPRAVWLVTALLLAAGSSGPDRLQVRHADHGSVLPRHPGLGDRSERAGQVLPGWYRRAGPGDLHRRQRWGGQDGAGRYAGHRVGHPAGDQGRAGLPAGDDDPRAGQPGRIHARGHDTDQGPRHPRRGREGGRRHGDQQGRGERRGS